MKTRNAHHPARFGQDPSALAGRRALDNRDWPMVERLCKERLRTHPKDVFAYRYLPLAQAEQGNKAAATQAYEAGLLRFPDDEVLLTNYSMMLLTDRQFERVYELSKHMTRATPKVVVGWLNFLWACYATGRFTEAVEAAKEGLKLPLQPSQRALMLNNLGTNLRDLGHLDEALLAIREALTLAPGSAAAHTNLLLFLQSKPDVSPKELRDAAECYARQFELPYQAAWPHHDGRAPEPHRRLRVGFLSPDFNLHSVAYFIEGLLPQLDRRQFQVLGLYLQGGEDVVTSRVRRHVDEFHRLEGLSADQLFQRLMALDIDILIDLAGHTATNGLGAMARKPAPVQVTWLGYPGTTGLTAIDWRVTDEIADEPGADAQYTEKLWRLPDVFCVYRPLSSFPLYRYQPPFQVQPTPALKNGYVTFGCCNNISKLTDQVLHTWARVLAQVPNSRLLIEGKGLDHPHAGSEFRERCARMGIEPGRLQLIGRDSRQQYLTYHQIDIALDPYPLTGGTTSTDLLWMGVPMVTMNGESFRSRMGVTLLHGLKRQEWIAQTEDDYVRIACAMASDTDRLNTERLGQRRRMEASPLMDETRFTSHFGHMLRRMWQQWCADRLFGDDTAAAKSALSEWASYRLPEQPKQVSIGPGEMIVIGEAHRRLQELTAQAIAVAPREVVLAGCTEPPPITSPEWGLVVGWCKYLLESIPNEPLALATLAEVENAHGRMDFALTYLRYAQEAMAQDVNEVAVSA